MRYLTEPEAWREIAKKLAVVRYFTQQNDMERNGEREPFLCRHVDRMVYEGPISPESRAEMVARLAVHMDVRRPSGRSAFPEIDWFVDQSYDVRILAAYFLALEAEDETTTPPRRGRED